jgi:hypothetical protein
MQERKLIGNNKPQNDYTPEEGQLIESQENLKQRILSEEYRMERVEKAFVLLHHRTGRKIVYIRSWVKKLLKSKKTDHKTWDITDKKD